VNLLFFSLIFYHIKAQFQTKFNTNIYEQILDILLNFL